MYNLGAVGDKDEVILRSKSTVEVTTKPNMVKKCILGISKIMPSNFMVTGSFSGEHVQVYSLPPRIV